MSYILDALKKAESERARGAIPGLSTNQADSTLYIVRDGWHPAWWLAAGLLAAALGYGFWPAAPAPASAPSLVPSPVPTQAAAPADVPVTAPVRVPVAIPATALAQAPTSLPVPATRPVPAPTTGQTQPQLQPKVQAELPAQTTAPVPLAVSMPSTAVASRPVGSTQPVPALADLPESLRRQMPALNITGAVYSDSPPEWALVVNDQVLGRGGQVAPELRLEEVSASSAVFSFRGQRFRIDR
jgi:general secretion pathway protein B